MSIQFYTEIQCLFLKKVGTTEIAFSLMISPPARRKLRNLIVLLSPLVRRTRRNIKSKQRKEVGLQFSSLLTRVAVTSLL
jgi:hypothetical protein